MLNPFRRKAKETSINTPNPRIFLPVEIQREIVGQVQEGFVFSIRVDPASKRWVMNKYPDNMESRLFPHSILICQDSPAVLTVSAQVCGQVPVALHTETVEPGTYLNGLWLSRDNR